MGKLLNKIQLIQYRPIHVVNIEPISQVLTISQSSHKSNLCVVVIWDLVNQSQFVHFNLIITLSVITKSGFECGSVIVTFQKVNNIFILQWKPLNVITDKVIIQLMLSIWLCPKVITLNGFHCNYKFYEIKKEERGKVNVHSNFNGV